MPAAGPIALGWFDPFTAQRAVGLSDLTRFGKDIFVGSD